MTFSVVRPLSLLLACQAHLLLFDSPSTVPIRTTQLTTITAPTFPLRLCSLQSLESLPLGSSFDRSDLVLDTLSASISAKSSQWDDEIPHLKIDGTSQDQANDVFKDKNGRPKREDVERVTPWYSVFKNILLGTRPMGEYETFQHPVCSTFAPSFRPFRVNAVDSSDLSGG